MAGQKDVLFPMVLCVGVEGRAAPESLTWLAFSLSDGGTAWVSQESFDVDETDSGPGVKWKNVARQLKEDLSSIILLSEEDLQVSLVHSPQHSPAFAVLVP